jgi:general secretion pathway protein H
MGSRAATARTPTSPTREADLIETRARARGFTLVELLVVLGVIAVLAAAAAPAIESVTGANARKAAGELSGTARHLFDTAALRHATCRLVLDLDARAWWAECAPGRAGISRDQDRERPEEDLAERFPDEKDDERRRLLAKTRFGAFEDRLVKRRELPGRAAFGPVRIEGRRQPIEAGIVHVHFFAGGRAQRAYVPVVDGDNVYTIVVEAMTGRARVEYGTVGPKE